MQRQAQYIALVLKDEENQNAVEAKRKRCSQEAAGRRPGPWIFVEIFAWACAISTQVNALGWDVAQ